LLFVFLFLLVIVAWPFLKVLTLGPHDQLARHDVILLCLAAVSTTALVTFFVVDVYRYADLEERVDAQLSNLASDIKCRFDDDLHSLLKAVERIRQTPPPQQVPREAGTIVNLKEPPKGDPYEAQLTQALLDGAFFERAVWIDSDGKQKYKRSLGKPSTPMIRVNEREYFK